MSKANEYADLKRHIKQLEEDNPTLAVLAFNASKVAVCSATAGRAPADAPLKRVVYKAGSDEIWLELVQGGYSWRQGTVAWNSNLVAIDVRPGRPRFELEPVEFVEVPH
ncbi:hypothetical protein N7638_17430 [Achromobacter mucicolens]|uniref:Uncharacterized protein n=1 Tax=Achromobacter aegrifaciens TaxID=1287736 RepID=A0AAD2J4U6_ACHAE|nr:MULTISPECIES: hypothetical protein [Achromobacter]MDG9969826.1 hypothetical protein [Achromobacter mucicolens]CAB3894295.1 hypothetical protein LMG26684_04262 [Achromobacter mucicolens]CUJ70665.1 Uncharacterised protein [Achromobacter aegrifaciens]